MSSRDFVVVYINGQRIQVDDDRMFMPLANFLRYEREKTGTKIVCAEGDCGACTVLFAMPNTDGDAHAPLEYLSCNSCIVPVYRMDGCSVITVEGIQTDRQTLDPVQEAFVACNASQCGFCTPGFIMASAGLYEQQTEPSAQDVKNYLTGNLCRCTGYDAIIKAGCSVDTKDRKLLKERYFDPKMHQEMLDLRTQSVQVSLPKQQAHYEAPTNLSDAVRVLEQEDVRLIAGATDLGVQINKGRHRGKRFLDLRLIAELYACIEETDRLVIGARVTLTELRRKLKASFSEYATYMNLFASPQIRNVGTLVGNVANASPIADSTPYLLMAQATVGLYGPNGYREVPMVDFYQGYKQLAMEKAELIQCIVLPKPHPQDFIRIYKISARRDLDIACVNLSASMRVEEGKIVDCRLAFGGVGPVIVRATDLEQALIGQMVSAVKPSQWLSTLRNQITPISDVRGSQDFRYTAAGNLFRKFFAEYRMTSAVSTVSS